MILLTCAVGRELAGLQIADGTQTLVTGVGVVEAACAVSEQLTRGGYSLVINAGIAGAFDGCAQIGDGVVVAEDRFALGRENGELIALPDGQSLVQRAASYGPLVAALRAHDVASLTGITVSLVTTSEETAARLARSGAHVETMEGFGVLRAAQRAGVPAIEVRGISNRVGDPSASGWDFDAGVAGLTRVLHTLRSVIAERSATA